MEKIVIRNFGPIPYCDLEVKDYMVFIGEQASGKSSLCKCIYFFKSLRDEIKSYLKTVLDNGLDTDKRFPGPLNTSLKYKFVNIFGLSRFKGNFSITYFYNDYLSVEITVTNDKNKYLDFKYSNSFVRHIREFEDKCNTEYQSLIRISDNDFYKDLERHKNFTAMSNQVNKLFNDDREIFYIPSGRGMISLLTNQLSDIYTESKNMDYITESFIKLIKREKSNFDSALVNIINHIDWLNDTSFKHKSEILAKEIQSILKGEYYYRDGKEYIRLKSNNIIPINFTSSGQQEMLWILNLLFLWAVNNKKVFVVIEEPEAHLFPNAQKDIVDFITYFSNYNDNQIIITTHSPYILTSLNNLLYAGKIGSGKRIKVDNIISNDKWINPSRFGAYIMGDGNEPYIRSIIDEELQEIAAEEIDVISKTIQSTYSSIFMVEANNEFTK